MLTMQGSFGTTLKCASRSEQTCANSLLVARCCKKERKKAIRPEAWVKENLPRREAWGGATNKQGNQGLKRTEQASSKQEFRVTQTSASKD